MGCEASVLVVGDGTGALADHAISRLDELERRWSRFRPASEISGLNRADGEARRCSTDTVRLVTASVQAWHATGGAFDPTLLGALVELGYATSRTDATSHTSLPPSAGWRGRPDEVCVDPATDVVRLPIGTTIDPGGLGKGLAADIVTAELLALGAAGALVEVGGDIAVAGAPPVGDHWLVDVAPTPADVPVRIALTSGGVATSSSRLRTWETAGGARHHLLDPERLRPTGGDVIACTVVAGSGAWSEAFTKVAFVRGADEAMHTYDQRGLAARITTDDGHLLHSRAWEAFAR